MESLILTLRPHSDMFGPEDSLRANDNSHPLSFSNCRHGQNIWLYCILKCHSLEYLEANFEASSKI